MRCGAGGGGTVMSSRTDGRLLPGVCQDIRVFSIRV